MSSGGVPATKELLRALKDQGWNVDTTKQGHYKALAPDGVGIVLFADTTEPRGMKNNLADLRRNGFQWPPPPKPRPVIEPLRSLLEAAKPAPMPTDWGSPERVVQSAARVNGSNGSNGHVAVMPDDGRRHARPAPDLDSLFKNLKDVKVELGAVESRLLDAERVVRQAEAALADAKEKARVAQDEVDMVKRLVMEAKAEFDQVFDVSA